MKTKMDINLNHHLSLNFLTLIIIFLCGLSYSKKLNKGFRVLNRELVTLILLVKEKDDDVIILQSYLCFCFLSGNLERLGFLEHLIIE